jgi:hypothetical protein
VGAGDRGYGVRQRRRGVSMDADRRCAQVEQASGEFVSALRAWRTPATRSRRSGPLSERWNSTGARSVERPGARHDLYRAAVRARIGPSSALCRRRVQPHVGIFFSRTFPFKQYRVRDIFHSASQSGITVRIHVSINI